MLYFTLYSVCFVFSSSLTCSQWWIVYHVGVFACGEVGLLGSQLLRGLVSRKKQCTCLNNVKKLKEREGQERVSQLFVSFHRGGGKHFTSKHMGENRRSERAETDGEKNDWIRFLLDHVMVPIFYSCKLCSPCELTCLLALWWASMLISVNVPMWCSPKTEFSSKAIWTNILKASP